jgi:hypothetical protein
VDHRRQLQVGPAERREQAFDAPGGQVDQGRMVGAQALDHRVGGADRVVTGIGGK